MLFITTGMPGSGKEEVLKVLKRTGLPIFRMGDVVRDHAKTNDAGQGDSGIGGHADAQRKEHGPEIWAERTLERISTLEEGSGEDMPDAVVDGSRSLKEIEYFKKNYKGNVVVIAVHCSTKSRYSRLKRRTRSDAPKTYEEFSERDKRELSWGIGEVIATADHLIVNESSLNEFKGEVRRLVGRLLI